MDIPQTFCEYKGWRFEVGSLPGGQRLGYAKVVSIHGDTREISGGLKVTLWRKPDRPQWCFLRNRVLADRNLNATLEQAYQTLMTPELG